MESPLGDLRNRHKVLGWRSVRAEHVTEQSSSSARRHLPLLTLFIGALVFGTSGLVGFLGAVAVSSLAPTKAIAQTAPQASSSFYVASTNYNLWYEEGYALGQQANCNYQAVVLDFGQVDGNGNNNAGYDGYGTNYFAAGSPFISDTTINYIAQYFLTGWHQATGCAPLSFFFGTNNYNQCVGEHATCDPSDAGAMWSALARDLQNWVDFYGYSSGYGGYMSIAGGDDMEAYSSQQLYWNNYSSPSPYTTYTTLPFAQGWNFGGYNEFGASFVDYGSPFEAGDWTYSEINNISWGLPDDYPYVEVYSLGQVAYWIDVCNAVNNAYTFFGSMSQDGNPNNAWSEPYDALPQCVTGQTSLTASTNISTFS